MYATVITDTTSHKEVSDKDHLTKSDMIYIHLFGCPVDSTYDDDDDEEDFLVDEENEIVEPDVDVHLLGISMDIIFDNISVTNIVPDDVLEGKDVNVINLDGFDSDLGNDDETNDYRRRRLAKLSREMEGVINASGQWKRNLKLYKNDNVRIRERCDGKVLVLQCQKGIIPAIKIMFPNAEHRYCLRHIHENMKQGWCEKASRICYRELPLLHVLRSLKSVFGQDGSGGSGAGAVIGSSAPAGQGDQGVPPPLNDWAAPPPKAWVNSCYWLTTWRETYSHKPNGVLKVLTYRKSVGSLPTHRLVLRYSADYTSSDSHPDTSSHSSLRHSHQTLLPPHKKIMDSDFVTDFEVSSEEGYMPYVPREVALGVDVEDNCEPYTKPDVDFDIQENINACIEFADDLRARGTDVRVMVETMAEEEVDSPDSGYRECPERPTTSQQSATISERIGTDRSFALTTFSALLDVIPSTLDTSYAIELADGRISKTNVILRGCMLGLLGHPFDIELMAIELSSFDVIVEEDKVEKYIGGLSDSIQRNVIAPEPVRLQDANVARAYTVGNNVERKGGLVGWVAQDVINELIAKRVYEVLKAYDAARNPETDAEFKNEQQDDHVEGDVNNGNGNGNGNENPNVNNKGVVPIARECTYQDFVKCQPLNFKGTNSYKMTVGVDDAYAITWQTLMKLMTEMVSEEEDKVEKYIGGLSDSIQRNVIAPEPVRLQDAVRLLTT
nr:reverse transcriptase domain-containing protein [Tanacetum cinerariifolium]